MRKVDEQIPLQPGADDFKPKILYVEDEEQNWLTTQLRLRVHYNLLWAKTAGDAVEVVRQHGPKLYAVLMDIQLKGSELDGIQLTRLFRGLLRRDATPAFAMGCPVILAPILFVTAYGSQYDENALKAAGGSAFITKPVDFVKLLSALGAYRNGLKQAAR